MANYYTSTIQKGSSGDDVLKWQRYLNKNYGLGLAEDGIFGDATYKATRDFQHANGLTGDGIVGEQTWGKAGFTLQNGTSSTNKPPSYTPTATPNVGPAPTAPTFNTTQTALPTIDTTTWDETETGKAALGDYNNAKDAVDNYGDFTYEDYKESDAVINAGNALNDHLANKPGEYQSQWQTALDTLMNQIMNREKFTYNMNEDALYQQYKDKYVQQGKMAMADTMGQAAAMTGGYGSSYAQSVGQQAYQGQLDNLNDIVPELYAMALDKYTREGQDLLNQYGLVMDREGQDYSRYRDTVADWLTDRGYLQGRYDSERDFDYGKYVDDRNMAHTIHQEGYQKLLDALGIASDDYYKGGDIFRTEQATKNNEAWNKYNADEDARQYANSLLQQGYQNDLSAWETEYNRAWDEYNATESANRYANDEAWRNAEWNRDESRYQDSLKQNTSGDSNENGNNGKGSYNNGSLSADQIKTLQKALGVSADGMYGEASMKAAGGLSAEEAYEKFVGSIQPQVETKDMYAEWDGLDWEHYFASIRQSEGKSAAEAELDRMNKAGYIPKNMVTYAASGARGGQMGH